MVRVPALVVVLALILSLGIGSIAHATEPVGCIDDAAELSIGHAEGDADQSMGHGGKTTPHHHGGCHGHHVSTLPDATASAIHLAASDPIMLPNFAGLPLGGAGPPLRPPIA